MKIKVQQLELFQDFFLNKEVLEKTGRCVVCKRKLKSGKIGARCRSVIKKQIQNLKAMLEE